jgi:chemotaxis protein CheC
MANETQKNTNTEPNARGGADGLSIPIRKLGVLNRFGQVGIDGVEHRLTRLDNYGATVESELVKSGYVDDESIGRTFDGSERVGVRVRVPTAPNGYALVLFSPESANHAAALMLSEATDDLSGISTEMARSALTELGGIMASGFVDGWANAFDQRIDIVAPTAVHNTEREIVRQTVGGDDALGLYITSRLRLPDHDVVAQVYLFPENETFVRILNRVEMGMMD